MGYQHCLPVKAIGWTLTATALLGESSWFINTVMMEPAVGPFTEKSRMPYFAKDLEILSVMVWDTAWSSRDLWCSFMIHNGCRVLILSSRSSREPSFSITLKHRINILKLSRTLNAHEQPSSHHEQHPCYRTFTKTFPEIFRNVFVKKGLIPLCLKRTLLHKMMKH